METGAINTLPQSKKISALVIEFIGSAVLTYSFYFVPSSPYQVGIATAYPLFYVIGANISGAHFNPAISFAIWLMERKRGYNYFGYFVMEIFA